ncbi:MAG: hypothetical protein M3Q19_02180 [Pseudomonadota bacterium]|nr:hypothetical protein [Pseudomonadota bacterium]
MSELPAPYDELDREIARMDFEASRDQAADRLRFQHEIGMAAVKSIMFANGGAILALLTFIGNRQGTYDKADLKIAFQSFSIGMLCTLAAYIAGYFSQGQLSNFDTTNSWNYQLDMKGEKRAHDGKWEGNLGTWFLAAGIGLVLGGLAFFAHGAFAALEGVLA